MASPPTNPTHCPQPPITWYLLVWIYFFTTLSILLYLEILRLYRGVIYTWLLAANKHKSKPVRNKWLGDYSGKYMCNLNHNCFGSPAGRTLALKVDGCGLESHLIQQCGWINLAGLSCVVQYMYRRKMVYVTGFAKRTTYSGNFDFWRSWNCHISTTIYDISTTNLQPMPSHTRHQGYVPLYM